jgi:hypothetical protein
MLGFALLWLLYVFSRSFFELPDSGLKDEVVFELDDMQNQAHRYFSVDQRQLLLIRVQDGFRVYWASDPIYGCRLEYRQGVIKPICIDIEYDQQGYSQKERQQLKSPDYEISGQQLRVYLR